MQTIIEILPYVIAVALAGVVLVLFAGVFTMARGGEFGRRNSNRFMRLRVALQALVIILLLVFWYLVQG